MKMFFFYFILLIIYCSKLKFIITQIALQTSSCSTVQNNKHTTRYIVLKSMGTLNISQVACYDDLGFNVAYGKSVTASSVYNDQINQNIITDGNLYARAFPNIYMSLENIESEVKIDLGKNFNIYKCVIYNRSDRYQNKIINTKVELWNSASLLITTSLIYTVSNQIDVFFDNRTYILLRTNNRPLSPEPNYFLQIAQIACYSSGGSTNLALNKPVNVSSVWDGSIVPSKITDGTLNARVHPGSFHSSGDDPTASVSIDLGSSQNIKTCTYYNRSDCCSNRIIGARLEIINNSNTSALKSYVFTSGSSSTTIDFA